MYFSCLCFFILIQIIGESLPISSSAHVQIFSVLSRTVLPEWYYYILHGPTIAILLIFFRKSLFYPLLSFFKYFSKTTIRRYFLIIKKLIALGILAELPALFFYILLQSFREELACNFLLFLPFGLLCTGFALASLRVIAKNSLPQKNTPSYADALIVGCAQAASLLPGVSRMAATYTVARWRGIEPTKAFRFSCVIQLPLIIMGFCKGLYEYKTLNYISLSFTNGAFVCMALATLISYGALYVTWLLVKREKFWYFSAYLIFPFIISLIIKISCIKNFLY